MARLRHVLVVVVMGSLVHAQGDETALECPYPEGQSVESEEECGRYSACQWNNEVCHMRSNGDAGYRTTAAPTLTPAGFQVMLEKTDPTITMFDGDIQQLMFEVINHEEYHVQIKGIWYHIVPGFVAAIGPTTELANAPLQAIPIYVKGGSILPYQEPALTTVESRQNPFGLTIALDESGSASGELYWDDGEEEHVMSEAYLATMTFAADTLSLVVTNSPAPMAGLNLETVKFYGWPADPTLIIWS